MVLDIPEVPVYCNVLAPTYEEALGANRGNICLVFCHKCGHLYNSDFRSELMEYTQDYENSLHFSPRFQEFATSLAQRLIDQYRLRNKRVIEIGCGKGDFLTMLCEMGQNKGIGFDRSYVQRNEDDFIGNDVTFIEDFFSQKYADLETDLICCRHVLEHIEDPRDMLCEIRNTIGNRSKTLLYFEVPNVMYSLKDLGIWDLIYEHCSYFNFLSLGRLFSMSDFHTCMITDCFGGQFLSIEAKPGCETVPDYDQSRELAELKKVVTTFKEKYDQKIGHWRERLDAFKSRQERVVLWGGGSKGVTFLNIVKCENVIHHMVDINPRKHGKFVPVSGQEIVAPDFLKELMPHTVIVMNPLYREEISQQLNRMNLDSKVIVA